MSHAIELKAVSKSFGPAKSRVDALREVSFGVGARENAAILGPSGCGKSTALRLIAGLEAPDSGEILFEGKAVSISQTNLVPPHLRGLSMVFQDLALWPGLSALENVILGLGGLRLPKKQAKAQALEALALCRIENLKDRNPAALSGGQQQRVALARALAVQPRYLLLDEPFTGLDLVTKRGLLDEIRELALKLKMTVILVTHDPLEVASLCEKAIVLDEGRVVESGSLVELLKTPRSQTLEAFKRV